MISTRKLALFFILLMAHSSAAFPNGWQDKNIATEAPTITKGRKVNLHRAIERYTKEYRLPSEELFASLLIAESNFNPCAISSAGAAGLSQLMPATARSIGVTDRFDIHQSLWGGASVLKSALNLTNGDITRSLGLYNWGSKSLKTPFNSWPNETRQYVKNITKKKKGFQANGWKKHVPKYIKYNNGQICNIDQLITKR
ncbi:MAG: soluble lytic murein transglycosylase-like protein [Cellvibrionaceae bacterium]|jgi:soluble lytic murein transglycosylase-like protein